MGVCILGMGDCNTETSTDISNITNNDTYFFANVFIYVFKKLFTITAL